MEPHFRFSAGASHLAAAAMTLLMACSGNGVRVAAPAGAGADAGSPMTVDPCVATADRPGVCPPRGVYDKTVSVQLSAADKAASLRYTLDGTEPSVTAGLTYKGPVAILGTVTQGVVVLKAVAVKAGVAVSQVTVHSYVFPQYVLVQSKEPSGLPPAWGNPASVLGRVKVTPADYEMDPKVVTDANRVKLLAAFKALPTVSVTTAPANLWDPATGIYMNAQESGAAWEREASMEFFVPAATKGVGGFAANCGISIQGGSSTGDWKSPKLSIEAKFKAAYGLSQLKYPLFDEPGATAKFDRIILDSHLNLTWIHPTSEDQRTRAVYVRDSFTADLQRAVDAKGTGVHSRFVNLFLNGLYWGVYDLHERPDEHFAGDYLGGTSADYDVLKHDANVPRNIVNGDTDAFFSMFDLACPGARACQPMCPGEMTCTNPCKGDAACVAAGCAAYFACTGLRDDAKYREIGKYLDIDAFINYMLVNFYADNQDWDYSNWYVARNKKIPGAGFHFFVWDAEWTLAGTGTVLNDSVVPDNGDVTFPDSTSHRPFATQMGPKPRELYYALMENPDFKAKLNKRADELLVAAGGALTPAKARALFDARIAEFRPVVLAESARWGDRVPRTFPPGQTDPYGPADFEAEVNRLVTGFFPERSKIVRQQVAASLLPLPPPPDAAPPADASSTPDAPANADAGTTIDVGSDAAPMARDALAQSDLSVRVTDARDAAPSVDAVPRVDGPAGH